MSGPAPTVLAFDTSAANCSAALLVGGQVVTTRHEHMRRGQAERLFPMLEEVLAEYGIGWSALDALGVGVGPGNFTGIRISVSAARGLALSLGIPAIGVTRFDALAEDAPRTPLMLTVSGPKDQIYVTSRHAGAETPADVVTIDTLPPADPDTTVIGDRSADIAERLGCAHAPPAHDLAVAIARIADKRRSTDTERPSPYYLRPAGAAPAKDPPPVLLP